jgi:hypothetical protein
MATLVSQISHFCNKCFTSEKRSNTAQVHRANPRFLKAWFWRRHQKGLNKPVLKDKQNLIALTCGLNCWHANDFAIHPQWTSCWLPRS